VPPRHDYGTDAKGSAGNLNEASFYKDYLIRTESFQREKAGPWVPQYTATRQNGAALTAEFPVQQYQFNHCYPTQSEADQFALRSARRWIDTYGSQNKFISGLPVQS